MENNRALEQAHAQMSSIHDMVAALEVDYDHLEELREASKGQRSVSHGTMRPVDLIPTFLAELDKHDSKEADGFRAEIPVTAMTDDAHEFWDTDDAHEFWDTDDAVDVLDRLFDALNDEAPDGCYFGAHPGDGSDYGFWMPEEDMSELAELEAAADGCESREDAEQRIQNDALSVEVRIDWHTPGDDIEPSEFLILLCTGGPAVQIRGELDGYYEPSRAWLEYQDWGTPWTGRANRPGDQDALLSYARCFYLGE